MSPDNQKRESQPVALTDLSQPTTVDSSTADKVKGGDIASPRDPATGLPTGKRM
jgi:hypothetical protein